MWDNFIVALIVITPYGAGLLTMLWLCAVAEKNSI